MSTLKNMFSGVSKIFSLSRSRSHSSCAHTVSEIPECCICCEKITGKNMAVMDCGHQFHYKCIFQWNMTGEGERCPLCRQDLDLPEIQSSSDSESDSESESDIDSDSDYDSISLGLVDGPEDETVDQRELRVSLVQEKCRKAMAFIIESKEHAIDDEINIQCKDCSKNIVTCAYCTEPFCACSDKTHQSHINRNPFNKYYNTVFDESLEDDEYLSFIGNGYSEERLCAKICDKCFTSRNYILWVALRVNDDDDILDMNEDSIRQKLDSNTIKTIYYHLFYDNSGIDNSSLYQNFPSFDTYDIFKKYVINKYISSNPRLDEEVDDIIDQDRILEIPHGANTNENEIDTSVDTVSEIRLLAELSETLDNSNSNSISNSNNIREDFVLISDGLLNHSNC